MGNDQIKRKQLYVGLDKVKLNDWERAARKLDIRVVYAPKGTSHYVTLRRPGFDRTDIRGLITTLTPKLFKQANQNIFKRVLAYALEIGKTEDDVWRALKMLK